MVFEDVLDVKVKRLRESASLPIFATPYSAGADLFADIDDVIEIAPHSTENVGTGLSFQPPHGYFGAIFARSGIARKQGLRPANCVGICDEDYTGEYIVALHNDTDEFQKVYPGERIAQLVFLPTLIVNFKVTDELEKTQRGEGGFGSTGVF